MSEEDEIDEIENAAQDYWESINDDHPASEEQSVKDAFAEGCEYWQSKLKERDELLEEMHDLLLKSKEYLVKAGVLDTWRIDKIITRYSNLKAK